MGNKVGITREQLERWQTTALQWGIDSIGVEIMHALAAPVVERQEPIMHITPQVLGMLKGELRMQSGGITFSESKPIGNWTVPLYTAPVSVALPDRDKIILRKPLVMPSGYQFHGACNYELQIWHACIDEVARLNGGEPQDPPAPFALKEPNQ